TRQAGLGLRRAASTPRDDYTQRRCCPTGSFWLRVEPALAALSRARNCTIRRTGVGLPRAALTPGAKSTRRTCCPTAWCSLQEEDPAALPRAQNSTIRRAGPGCPRAVSTPDANSTRRTCCPMGWCWLQGDSVQSAAFLQIRDVQPRNRQLGSPG